MFLVFSKEKITTYLVSILTVALLFCMVANFQTHKTDVIETSANTGKLLPISKTEHKSPGLLLIHPAPYFNSCIVICSKQQTTD